MDANDNPFGDEWEQEVLEKDKSVIVDMLRDALLTAQRHFASRLKSSRTLAACPFCGSPKEALYMDSKLIDDTHCHFVACRKCGAEGPPCSMDDGEKTARRAWNGAFQPYKYLGGEGAKR